MEATKELDLREVFSALVRRIWLIALCAILVGAAAYVYTAAFVTPLYQASVSIYVNNTKATVNGITSGDLATSQKLVETYMNILTSNTVLERVAEEVGGEISAAQIRTMLESEAMGETEVFRVKVSNADPELAAEIANVIAEIAPERIGEIVSGSSAKIVDYAKVPEAPYTPNRIKNALLGACAGALLIIIVVVLQVLLDVHIKNETDLRKLSNAPVLGIIPDYDVDYKKGGYESDKATKDETMGEVV